MTRRKSRPLLPYEILPSPGDRESPTSSSPSDEAVREGIQQQFSSSQSSIQDSQILEDSLQDQMKEEKILAAPNSLALEHNGLLSLSKASPPVTFDQAKAAASTESKAIDTPGFGLLIPPPTPLKTVVHPRVQLTSVRTAAGLVDLTNQPNNTCSTQQALENITYSSNSVSFACLTQSMKRTSSLARLSMSLDGKAQVVTGDFDSPSPPRPQQWLSHCKHPRPVTLQRSKSAIGTSSLPSEGLGEYTLPWPRRTTVGRSRDARTWEFYCDSDARNALSLQAEQEKKGSAIGAIGLIRSRSNKAMIPSMEKHNANPAKQDSVKRKQTVGLNGQKPKLARTTSSVARLQTINNNTRTQVPRSKIYDLKASSKSELLHDPSGDSDKENWEPGRQVSNVRRPRAPKAESFRRILQENSHMPSHSTSLDAVLNREDRTPRRQHCSSEDRSRQEKEDPEVDEEVAAFMGERSVSGKEEDLDCVQNLLSLSQGAWR